VAGRVIMIPMGNSCPGSRGFSMLESLYDKSNWGVTKNEIPKYENIDKIWNLNI
jgi:hypothetical protein